jgi:hypothetical protein
MHEVDRNGDGHWVQTLQQEADNIDHQVTIIVLHSEHKKASRNFLDMDGPQK